MRRFWLLFAQTVTIALALYFVYGALRPASRVQQLGSAAKPVPVVETASSSLAPGSYRDAAARAMPAVVNILTLQVPKRGAHPLARDPFFKRFFGERDPDDGDGEDLKNSLGSGVIVSHEGYVLTNNHVVEGADEIEVVLTDGRKAPAKIVGLDPETDLAVIKINLDKLPVIVLGQSELARVGDVVLAIGNPFGVGQTVTSGIVSALGRNQLGINTFENFIQTDAAINPGNSGGALVDVNGNLMGINTAIYSRSGGSMGIGFAIPVSTARLVLDGIVKDGQVTRGWIGVEPNELSPELAETFGVKATEGVIITGVLQDGPAAQAGMRPGDVIVRVDGKNVGNVSELLTAVAALKPGTAAPFNVQRGDKMVELNISPGVRPRPQRNVRR